MNEDYIYLMIGFTVFNVVTFMFLLNALVGHVRNIRNVLVNIQVRQKGIAYELQRMNDEREA